MGINFDKNIPKKNNINQFNIDKLSDELKKYICEIYIDKIIKGIGFFCYIPFPDKKNLLPSLITNNHLINGRSKTINIKILYNKKETKTIELNNKRKIYTSEKYDTTIIEIKPNKDQINYFLELDENINAQNLNEIYSEKTIYIIDYSQFVNETNISISFGILKKISEKNKYDIYHLCSSENNFSGSPILFLSNNKVIGIQKEITNSCYDFNKGTFLKYPIIEFINKGKKLNEILISIKIEDSDFNKNIYFLNNIEYKDNKKSKTKNDLFELTNKNTELFINNIKYKFQKFFIPRKVGIYQIKLKLSFNINNCYKMFYNCNNIISIDLSFFDSSKVTNTSYMFSRCNNLLYINLSNFDASKIKNMSYMFSHCGKLVNIDLSSFNTETLYNMSYMFYNCCNISDINFLNFNTMNVTDMSFLFYNCKNLININLDSFNTKKVVDMSNMFCKCKKLTNINLYSFNTENVSNMSQMFSHCHKLAKIDLSMFDTENVIDISSLFSFCTKLIRIDLSMFDLKNIRYMNDMFLNCHNLTEVNFPSFNINNIRNMSYMFHNCWNLSFIKPEFFVNKNITNFDNIFHGCINLFNIEYI